MKLSTNEKPKHYINLVFIALIIVSAILFVFKIML